MQLTGPAGYDIIKSGAPSGAGPDTVPAGKQETVCAVKRKENSMGSYGEYFGKSIGKLGFGLMRLPKQPDSAIGIDVEQVKKMVDRFMAAGMTYFDTAYIYDGGNSERAIKEALVDRYPRESYLLATKMNAWIGNPTEKEVKRQLDVSLERTGAKYFDFYLLHALQENNVGIYDAYGLWDFVKQCKEEGKIRHWGFSYHASPELLDELLTAHPDVDFIQLQINYADWDDPSVASGANYEVAAKHGVPFVIMEPVKGGMLANLPESAASVFRKAAPDKSLASWAIRFAASLDGCITVLSGMSNLEQMEDNLSYMTDFHPLDESEREIVRKAVFALKSVEQIECTGCRYCMKGCPMGIRIPEIFRAMNRSAMNDTARADRIYQKAISEGAAPSDCLACGQCESVCPQGLPIIELLGKAGFFFDY